MKRILAILAVTGLATLGLSAPAGAIDPANDPARHQGQATRLYSAYFLRDPDLAGLRFWIGRLQGGQPLEDVSLFFSQSEEFENRYGSLNNSEFVDLVYQNVLDRDPDVTGKAFWLFQLGSGAYDRGRMMVGFSESPEFVEQTGTTPPGVDGFTDGTHTDVAGTWRNITNGEECTWERIATLADEEAEIDEEVIVSATVSGPGRSIVTIDEADAAFRTSGCGAWVVDIGPITVSPLDPFEAGTYRVERDVAAGTWESDGDDECQWARLSGFGGTEAEVIEAGSGADASATIDETDAGFWANEACGTWTPAA